jgi:hypothetical protein
MLSFLHAAERDSWHHFMTGDESLFFFDTSPRWCKLCREIMWLQNRDSKFRAKVYVHDYMESDWVLCCRQTSK